MSSPTTGSPLQTAVQARGHRPARKRARVVLPSLLATLLACLALTPGAAVAFDHPFIG
jgi:hypothetical protein